MTMHKKFRHEHLGMTILHSEKVARKIHQNRLIHLGIAMVKPLGDSDKSAKILFKGLFVLFAHAHDLLITFWSYFYFTTKLEYI